MHVLKVMISSILYEIAITIVEMQRQLGVEEAFSVVQNVTSRSISL